MKKHQQYSPTFKAKLALEVLREEKSLAQIASDYDVHPTMVNAWRRELLEKLPEVFEDGRKKKESDSMLTWALVKQLEIVGEAPMV